MKPFRLTQTITTNERPGSKTNAPVELLDIRSPLTPGRTPVAGASSPRSPAEDFGARVPRTSSKNSSISQRSTESSVTNVSFKRDSLRILDNKKFMSLLVTRNRSTGRLAVNFETMYVTLFVFILGDEASFFHKSPFRSDGSAKNGINFKETKAVVLFKHGEDTATIDVPILKHRSANSSPSFYVRLVENPHVRSVCKHRRGVRFISKLMEPSPSLCRPNAPTWCVSPGSARCAFGAARTPK